MFINGKKMFANGVKMFTYGIAVFINRTESVYKLDICTQTKSGLQLLSNQGNE